MNSLNTAVAGQTAAYIAHGLAQLGVPPVILEPDRADYDLIDVMERTGTFGLLHIGPDDPKAMLAYADQARELGLDFSADPGRLEGTEAVDFIEGAKFLVGSRERYQFLQAATGLTDDQILAKVRVRITTDDADGIEVVGHDIDRVHVGAARLRGVIDPAGAPEAATAGLLAAIGWGMGLRRAAEVAGQMAVIALESVGPQGYTVNPVDFMRRLEESYGAAAAAEASAYLLPE
ncbi:hypothetical protein [Glycomyces buryatensis]|uniref:Carbohydrate kinase PfkB domain-containing protein n=1 Tax=Glycomyces buryatensis TaxID=2570927 RepID=A0A4S8QHY6_9ACTN|nr:hypothetical protein [Glycomyces buryatensis]THV42595.1 hypothetical protein FAB82_05330 [Glycomyces buryatensis]